MDGVSWAFRAEDNIYRLYSQSSALSLIMIYFLNIIYIFKNQFLYLHPDLYLDPDPTLVKKGSGSGYSVLFKNALDLEHALVKKGSGSKSSFGQESHLIWICSSSRKALDQDTALVKKGSGLGSAVLQERLWIRIQFFKKSSGSGSSSS